MPRLFVELLIHIINISWSQQNYLTVNIINFGMYPSHRFAMPVDIFNCLTGEWLQIMNHEINLVTVLHIHAFHHVEILALFALLFLLSKKIYTELFPQWFDSICPAKVSRKLKNITKRSYERIATWYPTFWKRRKVQHLITIRIWENHSDEIIHKSESIVTCLQFTKKKKKSVSFSERKYHGCLSIFLVFIFIFKLFGTAVN